MNVLVKTSEDGFGVMLLRQAANNHVHGNCGICLRKNPDTTSVNFHIDLESPIEIFMCSPCALSLSDYTSKQAIE